MSTTETTPETTMAARLAAAEAEIERLRAELAEAEERAAGPFCATCAEVGSYGRRLEDVIDEVLLALAERLEDQFEPEEWPAVVAGWAIEVEHGVTLEPHINDDGEPTLMVKEAAGWWHYDLALTVTPDGQPVLSAERRAGGGA